MDKLDTFIKKWTGVGIDTDGYFKNQCMDLLHRFCQDVLGLSDLSILASPNAKSVYNNFNNIKGHELFDKIPNTPTGVPAKGDIMLYDWGINGHVDLFIQGDVNSFRSFSQNWPTGSKCNVVNHPNYSGVLGWLRLKPTEPMATITQKELNAIIETRNSNWDNLQTTKKENETLIKEFNKNICILGRYREDFQTIVDIIEKLRNI